jgi:hypothetical protein
VAAAVVDTVACAVRLAVTEPDRVRLDVPVRVCVSELVTVMEGVQELVSDRLFVGDSVVVAVFEGVAWPVPDPLTVRVPLFVIDGVGCALRLLLGVTVELAVRVVVEVLDQGLGVWLVEAVLEAVLVRLAVIEDVTVGVWLWVSNAEGVWVVVWVMVREAVRLPELVRLGVPVLRALTVLETEGVCERVLVPVVVPVTEIVWVVVRVLVGSADEERVGVIVA